MRIPAETGTERDLSRVRSWSVVLEDLDRSRILREALKARHDEPFEKALGRAIRHLGGDYAQYQALIEEVREYGEANHIDLRLAARALASQP